MVSARSREHCERDCFANLELPRSGLAAEISRRVVVITGDVQIPERARHTTELDEDQSSIYGRSVRRKRIEICEHLAGEKQSTCFFGVRDGTAYLSNERARVVRIGEMTQGICDTKRSPVVRARLAPCLTSGIGVLELLAERDQ